MICCFVHHLRSTFPDVTEIVGDRNLEDPKVQQQTVQAARGNRSPGQVAGKRLTGVQIADLKENVAKQKKKARDIEEYADSVRKQLQEAQDALIAELEAKNKVHTTVICIVCSPDARLYGKQRRVEAAERTSSPEAG